MVTVLLAGLGKEKLFLLHPLIIKDLCFSCPLSSSITFTANQCVHWSPCSVKNYSSSRSNLQIAVPLTTQTGWRRTPSSCICLSCGCAASLCWAPRDLISSVYNFKTKALNRGATQITEITLQYQAGGICNVYSLMDEYSSVSVSPGKHVVSKHYK